MFASDTPSHTHSLRPKRTRQAAPDDSLKLPQAKRKRSALRRDTFEPLTDASPNEIAVQINGDVAVNGHVTDTENAAAISNPESKTLALRGGKKAEKRQDRTTGALLLSSNEFYNVTQLPALPDQIRVRPAVAYSTAISTEYGYILASTHAEALLWSYNSSSSSPMSRDLFSFKLPFPPSSAIDPLPLIAFTAKSAAGEPGIVIISSKWGKVVYWETITNASSVVPGQTSSGVQGSIPGLSIGEIVQEIANAEPAGFIITTNQGRVAHLTIRDQVGRPGIGIQFLRKTGTVSSLYGSIRKAFGADRRKGTPMIRAGRTTKGQRDIVIGTENGNLEFWNINLGAGNSLTKSIGIKEDLLEALKHNLPGEVSTEWQFRMLDFELAAGPGNMQELVRRDDHTTLSISVLVALAYQNKIAYYIIELIATEGSVEVKVVHLIKCYTVPIDENSTWKVKLFVPEPYTIAFVVFERAVLLVSLARVQESPSSQLLLERNALPDPFQDCIKFREDTIYRVLGCAVEEHSTSDKNTNILLAVQGYGVVRITSLKQQELLEENDDFEATIGPKSKIEQVVFFGTNRQNPLDLTSSMAVEAFTDEEISSAALEISTEILCSTSKYLPKSTPSIETQMKMRAKALDDLIHYLMKFHASSFSRTTKFQLLWNAEKLAGAQALWKVQEEIQRPYRTGHQDRKEDGSYLQFVLRALHESRQTYPDETKGQTDRVRHWLIHDSAKLSFLLSELSSCIPELQNMFVTDPQTLADYHREATDLWNAVYEAAFKFREDNASAYGLVDEVFKNGVLQAGYPDDLPMVWTAAKEPLDFGTRLIYHNCEFLREWWDYNPIKDKKKKLPTGLQGQQYHAPTKKALDELASRLPKEVELYSRLVEEENLQVIQRLQLTEPDAEELAATVALSKRKKRDTLRQAIAAISEFNMPGAISLAENLRDAELLVTLNTEYIKQLIKDGDEHPDRVSANEAKIEEIQDHAESYYDTLQHSWAWAHFSRMIVDGDLGAMLKEAQDEHDKKQSYLTWFLKKCKKQNQPVGKISWINDVIGERNFHSATRKLEDIAMQQETDQWNKRTELCLAKLAGLAANEVIDEAIKTGRIESTSGTGKRIDTKPYDKALEMLDIQERILNHVLSALGPTIDMKAAQDLAKDKFAKRVIDKMPGLRKQLKHALDALVENYTLSAHQLVDLLTLMDPVEYDGSVDDDPEVLNAEFFLALRVVDGSDDIVNSEKDVLRRTIWRRAMVRDDWLALNDTNDKDDKQVEDEMSMTALFRTLLQIFTARVDNSKLFSPQQILEADPFPESLQARFKESEIKHLRSDLEGEQEKLRKFVEQGRLQEHYLGLITTAERAVRKAADAKGDEMAAEALSQDENGNEAQVNGA